MLINGSFHMDTSEQQKLYLLGAGSEKNERSHGDNEADNTLEKYELFIYMS